MPTSSVTATLLGPQTVALRVPERLQLSSRIRVRCRRLFPACLLFVVLILQLSVRLFIVREGYELERVRATALKQDAELRELRLELAMLTRPSSLAERARTDLGMLAIDRSTARTVVLDYQTQQTVRGGDALRR